VKGFDSDSSDEEDSCDNSVPSLHHRSDSSSGSENENINDSALGVICFTVVKKNVGIRTRYMCCNMCEPMQHQETICNRSNRGDTVEEITDDVEDTSPENSDDRFVHHVDGEIGLITTEDQEEVNEQQEDMEPLPLNLPEDIDSNETILIIEDDSSKNEDCKKDEVIIIDDQDNEQADEERKTMSKDEHEENPTINPNKREENHGVSGTNTIGKTTQSDALQEKIEQDAFKRLVYCAGMHMHYIDDDKKEEWAVKVVNKFNKIGVVNRRQFIYNYMDINNQFRKMGIKSLKQSSLEAIMLLISMGISEEKTPSLTAIFTEAGTDLWIRDRPTWGNAIANRLRKIGITSITQFLMKHRGMNKALRRKRLLPIRLITLSFALKRTADLICFRDEAGNGAVNLIMIRRLNESRNRERFETSGIAHRIDSIATKRLRSNYKMDIDDYSLQHGKLEENQDTSSDGMKTLTEDERTYKSEPGMKNDYPDTTEEVIQFDASCGWPTVRRVDSNELDTLERHIVTWKIDESRQNLISKGTQTNELTGVDRQAVDLLRSLKNQPTRKTKEKDQNMITESIENSSYSTTQRVMNDDQLQHLHQQMQGSDEHHAFRNCVHKTNQILGWRAIDETQGNYDYIRFTELGVHTRREFIKNYVDLENMQEIESRNHYFPPFYLNALMVVIIEDINKDSVKEHDIIDYLQTIRLKMITPQGISHAQRLTELCRNMKAQSVIGFLISAQEFARRAISETSKDKDLRWQLINQLMGNIADKVKFKEKLNNEISYVTIEEIDDNNQGEWIKIAVCNGKHGAGEICNHRILPISSLRQICINSIWVADTGSSSNQAIDEEGFVEVYKEDPSPTFGAWGDKNKAKFIGRWTGRQYHLGKDNKQLVKGPRWDLKEVQCHGKKLMHNLYSLTQVTEEGGRLFTEGNVIIAEHADKTQIRFDYKIKTKKGHVMAAIVQPIGLKEYLDEDEPVKLDINIFHKQILHRSADDLIRTASKLNIRLIKELEACVNCARAKIVKAIVLKGPYIRVIV